MGQLTQPDRLDIEDACDHEVLNELDQSKLKLGDGLILGGACPDADQLPDMLRDLSPFVTAQTKNSADRIHTIAVNGGALVLSFWSPLSNLARFLLDFLREPCLHSIGRVFYTICWPLIWFLGFTLRQDVPLMINIWMAVKLKGIKIVGLVIHAPCGAAAACKMSFADQVQHLIRAKRRLKKIPAFKGIKFPCFCHVDYGFPDTVQNRPQKVTYFIKTSVAWGWLVGRLPKDPDQKQAGEDEPPLAA